MTDEPRAGPDPLPPVSSTAEHEEWELVGSAGEPHRSLAELINRVLDRGVVLHGDVMLSVAGVDLVYLGLNALLTSVSTARRTGLAVQPADSPPPAGTPTSPPPPAEAEAEAERQPERPASPAVGSLQRRSTAAPATPPAGRVEDPSTVARAGSEALAAEFVEVAGGLPSRVDLDPDAVQRDLARLVLTLVELLRQVVEHQAVRRMEDGDLSDEQIERMGIALLRLQEKLREIKAVFGLADDELNIDLGPLGKLL